MALKIRLSASDWLLPLRICRYRAGLGELKGGIDPAGADEHWKTASTALRRIRESFAAKGNPVHTFFVGAAIEASMAREIFAQCESGELGSAANLTNQDQLAELCAWLIDL